MSAPQQGTHAPGAVCPWPRPAAPPKKSRGEGVSYLTAQSGFFIRGARENCLTGSPEVRNGSLDLCCGRKSAFCGLCGGVSRAVDSADRV